MNECSLRRTRRSRGEVQLPYGEAEGGRMLHISEVPSGKACGCKCPECDAQLVARKGPKTEHHFAHKGSSSCKGAYETMLHKLAKQVLLDRGMVKTPPVVAIAGDEKRVLFAEQMFKLTSVEEEVTLPGMRPDILGRRGEHELLIEVKVTHSCGEEKLRRIREQGRAAIEIDMSAVRRDAPKDVVEDAIVSSAPREWLYNKRFEAAVDEMRREQARRAAEAEAKKQKAIRAEADRALHAWRSKPVTPQVFRPFASIQDGGLEHLVGLPIGDGCFVAPARYWQGFVVDKFVVRPSWHQRQFRAADVLEALKEAGLVKPGLGFVSDEATETARAADPDFLSPYEAVQDYLEELAERKALVNSGRGRWFASSQVSDRAQAAMKEAAGRRERVALVGKALVELMNAIGDHGVDAQVWMQTRYEGLDDTPEALAAKSDWEADKLKQHLHRLKEMFLGRGAVEERLLGFPLEAAREDRRRVLAEEKRQREEEARRAEEVRRQRATEAARQEALYRRTTAVERAHRLLGTVEAGRFLDEPRQVLSGRSLREIEQLTEAQSEHVLGQLHLEHRRLEALWEQQRQEADRRSRLDRAALAAHGDERRAQAWIGSTNPALGYRRPRDICVTEAGLSECLAALKPPPRRGR